MRRDPSLIPLSRQHHDGLALCVLARRALERDASQANVERQARRIADRFELELAGHFRLEERVLFAGAEAELGPMPLIAKLMDEHRRMEAAVKNFCGSPSRDDVIGFCTLLTAHIRREESELFENLQRRLKRETLDRMGAELEAGATRICL